MREISPRVIERSFLYIRILSNLIRQRKEVISSRELAELSGLSDVNVRKDISNFKKVGKPGVGYRVKDLKEVLEEYVLRASVLKVVLFGVGNLGQAILKYPGFRREKLKIVAAFDCDRSRVGRSINDVRVYRPRQATAIIRNKKADVGIVAVPENAGQEVADIMVSSGLKALVNFSTATLEVPEGVFVKNIDFTIEFLALYCRAQGIK